jgi:hypothetical protein
MTFLSVSERGSPMAHPAGETCLKEAADGSDVAFFSSWTSGHAFNASSKLMYPGLPFSTTESDAYRV